MGKGKRITYDLVVKSLKNVYYNQNLDKRLICYYLQEKLVSVKQWYKGYIFDGETIYNPWLVLNYIDNSEKGFMGL